MSALQLNKFLCWKLKIAVVAICFYTVIAAGVATLLEIFDIADQFSDNFYIRGGFEARWRMHVWEGWLACNIVMIVLHIIMIITAVIMFFGVRRFPTFYEFTLTKVYLVFMICYTLAELGVACYKFSWIEELRYEITYGEKKLLAGSKDMLDTAMSRARSGMSTPRSGFARAGSQQLLGGPMSQSQA
ncbi:DgyrCDS4107 [Dimorphilus gyrociliatus]|uniref:DgyrCDS4107 n=1 Tax=Dimorphilus gyrociliatus TaxID=2664684 RepID=A0A7I8VHF4_9ANNE|nr:DgyrCDS4107 [Dimorphilus gyrociliatus]